MISSLSNINFTIANSIKEIPENDWNALFGDLIEGYGYHKTLEESGMKEFSFGYVLGRKNGKVIAVLPFFVMDFCFDNVMEGFLHRIAQRFRKYLKVRALFLGCPTSEKFYMGVSKKEDLREVVNKALEKLSKYCKDKKIAGIVFYNLSEKEKPLAEYLNKRKYTEMEGLPGTVIKIEHDSLEGYFSSLSRNMRKDLRKKIRRSAAKVKLRTEIRQDIDGISDEIYKLYLNNFNDSDVHFETLTPEFFQNICRNIPEAKYFITYDGEKIVAFNLCIIKNGIFLDKFIGMDRDIAREYHLYFMTFIHNLQWCMQNGIQFYEPGNTDYHPKIRLGAKLVPLYLYVKAFNPVLNTFLKLFKEFIQPKNLDDSLKNTKWFEMDGKYLP